MSDLYKNAIGKEFGKAASDFDKSIIDALNAKLGTNLNNLSLMITDDDDNIPEDSTVVTTKLSHVEGALVRVYVQSDEIEELKDNPYIDVDDTMYEQFSNVVLGAHLMEQCDVSADALNPLFIDHHHYRNEYRGKL